MTNMRRPDLPPPCCPNGVTMTPTGMVQHLDTVRCDLCRRLTRYARWNPTTVAHYCARCQPLAT